jgi:hypothetical protein
VTPYREGADMSAPTVSEETALRIAEALERIAAVVEQQREEEPVSFPNAPALPKRGAGRGR